MFVLVPCLFQILCESLTFHFYEIPLDLRYVTFAKHECVIREGILGIKLSWCDPTCPKDHYMRIFGLQYPEDHPVVHTVGGAGVVWLSFCTWNKDAHLSLWCFIFGEYPLVCTDHIRVIYQTLGIEGFA